MRFYLFVLAALYSLPTWSTSAEDNPFSPYSPPKPLLKASKSTSAPNAVTPFFSGGDRTLAQPHARPTGASSASTSTRGQLPALHDAAPDDVPSPDEASQTSPRSLFSWASKHTPAGQPSSALHSSGAKRTTPRTPRGSPRTDSDSSPRSIVVTEITTLSSSSSEGLHDLTQVTGDLHAATQRKGRRLRNAALPLATPITPKGLASATRHAATTSSPRTPPSPTSQEDDLCRTATPPLLLPPHEYREDEDDRTTTPPLIMRTLQPMPVGEATDAVVDFCVYERAFFETMRTQNSVLMRRNVVHEHRLFERVMALPFEEVVNEYKNNRIDLTPVTPHFPELMTFFLYLTHNAREFEHRYIARVKTLTVPSLEATMLLITRLHIFSLQHQRRIHNTYRALYQLCSDDQRNAFEETVRAYNASIEGEYASIAATSSSSSGSQTHSSVPANLMYNVSNFHDTWRNEASPPRAIQFLLGLSQDDQNKYFEPVKSNPSFFDIPGTSRVFPALLMCDSPFIGILKSYHLEREMRLERVQESPLGQAISSPSSSSSSSFDEHISSSFARASSSDKPLRPRTSSAGAHFADGLRPQKTQNEHGDHRKLHLPHLPSLHLPSMHLPSSFGALKLSPRGTHHITPPEKPAGPGYTPRSKKHADQILTKQQSLKNLSAIHPDHSTDDGETIRETDDAYPEIPQRQKRLSSALTFRGTGDLAPHVPFVPETDTDTITQSGIDDQHIDFRKALRTISKHTASAALEHTPMSSGKSRAKGHTKSSAKKSKSHKRKTHARKKKSRA